MNIEGMHNIIEITSCSNIFEPYRRLHTVLPASRAGNSGSMQ